MSSQKESFWRWLLRRCCPFLFKKCPLGNFHWRRDRYCHCGYATYSSTWHGGILDFRSGRELWSAKEIAEHFFYQMETYHPLQHYWEETNRKSEGENYPYSYFKKSAIRTLAELITQHAADVSGQAAVFPIQHG